MEHTTGLATLRQWASELTDDAKALTESLGRFGHANAHASGHLRFCDELAINAAVAWACEKAMNQAGTVHELNATELVRTAMMIRKAALQAHGLAEDC